MLTSLGRFLRKLRIDRNELLKDMAAKLDVSVSFLSAVENGKKHMPASWNKQICDLYDLTESQRNEFTNAVAETEDSLDMILSGATMNSRRLAVSFARNLPYFTDEQIEAMQQILEGRSVMNDHGI